MAITACGGSTADIPGGPGRIDGPGTDVPSQVPPITNTPPPEQREHDARFIGLWIVDQPFHAAYERTFYHFESDGRLVTGSSFPTNCASHLTEHCVTGTVANCQKSPGSGQPCTSTITCVFGDEWFSKNGMLGIVGKCSDLSPRTIWIHFGKDASLNTQPGGANGAVLHSVNGDTNWSHDNWEWAFRKCPTGTTEATCL
jgi:hypothetical protein